MFLAYFKIDYKSAWDRDIKAQFFFKWSIFYALSNGYNIIEIWGQLIFFDFFTENMFSEHVFWKTLKLTISRLRIEVSGRIFFLKWSIFFALSDGDTFRAIRGRKIFFEKNVKKNMFVKKTCFDMFFFMTEWWILYTKYRRIEFARRTIKMWCADAFFCKKRGSVDRETKARWIIHAASKLALERPNVTK